MGSTLDLLLDIEQLVVIGKVLERDRVVPPVWQEQDCAHGVALQEIEHLAVGLAPVLDHAASCRTQATASPWEENCLTEHCEYSFDVRE